jgi:hypothetical protein
VRRSPWLLLPVAALSAPAYATAYLTIEQAQQLMFPGQVLTPAFVALTDAQRAAIAARAGVAVPGAELRLWRAPDGGCFIADEVVGKHELIGYALGLNADGSVRQVEILAYRESYGWEIRNQAWRRQFVGKTAGDPVLLDRDIRNISGATLSSRHVTEGVRRLLATYALVVK